MSEPIREKRYDIQRDKTFYEFTEAEIRGINRVRADLGLPEYVFTAPGADAPEQHHSFHYEPGDCPQCAEKGPHLVEGTS